MTADQLIAEGRKLQRPCYFLRPEVSGEVAAIWHEPDEDEIEETGHHCWLTVDTRFIPGLPAAVSGYLSVFSNEDDCSTGKVQISPAWPKHNGVKLYAHRASVLPPFESVMARGSEAVGEWLSANGWERNCRYNGNFKDKNTANAYLKAWQTEYPLFYESDIYAVLGGWHWPGQDDDWYDLIDEHLMVLTIHNSEPWVEAWLSQAGDYKVIQRNT